MQNNKIMNKKPMNKKGDMSLQVVIVAVICIAVLAVLIIIFAVNTGKFSFGVSSCEARGGVCGDYTCKDVVTTGGTCGTAGVVCTPIPGTKCTENAKIEASKTKTYCCTALSSESIK